MQAAKIIMMLCVFWGIMWCLGLTPWQIDPAALEQRLQGAAQQQQAAAAAAHGDAGTAAEL